MKVFISWSGEQTRELAHALKTFIDVAFAGHVNSFLSDKDIAPGERFYNVINTGLSESSLGVVLLTRANMNEPWILFEAGALAGKTDGGSVVPLLVDLERASLVPPLSQFQNAYGSREADIRRLCARITGDAGAPMNEQAFELLFANAWPKLQGAIETARSFPSTSSAPPQPRDQGEILNEILLSVTALVRASESGADTTKPARSPAKIRDNGDLRLAVGDRIRHIEFGEGTVTSIANTGAKTIATVDFADSGTKKLLVKVAPITLLE